MVFSLCQKIFPIQILQGCQSQHWYQHFFLLAFSIYPNAQKPEYSINYVTMIRVRHRMVKWHLHTQRLRDAQPTAKFTGLRIPPIR